MSRNPEAKQLHTYISEEDYNALVKYCESKGISKNTAVLHGLELLKIEMAKEYVPKALNIGLRCLKIKNMRRKIIQQPRKTRYAREVVIQPASPGMKAQIIEPIIPPHMKIT